MTTYDQVLQSRVGAVQRRIRLLLGQQWMVLGLTYAALAGLLLVLATRLQWWTDAVDYVWALLLLGAVTGFLVGLSRRITPLVAAQIADDRAGLKERLSTAVELSGSETRSSIAEAQIQDAARHAEELRPAAVLPWRMPPQSRYLALAVTVLLGAIYLPDLPFFQSRQERTDREVMRVQGSELKKVAKEIEKKAEAKKKAGEEDGEVLKQIARNMKQLGRDQERNRISKKQALLKMNELKKQLEQAEQKMGEKSGAKSMDKVTDQLNRAAQDQQQKGNSENAAALKQMAENLEKKDFDGAKKQLEEIARKMQAGELSPEDAGKAAEMLKQMAEAMEGSSLDKAGDQLKDAAKQLRQASEMAKQLQQQMAQASPEQRQQLQQQMAQAMQQGAQSAASQCQQAGGT